MSNYESIDIGKGKKFSTKFLPEGEYTGLKDINGDDLCTGDKVCLEGCISETAYIGYNINKSLVLIFGTATGIIGWDLNEEVIKRRKIIKLQ